MDRLSLRQPAPPQRGGAEPQPAARRTARRRRAPPSRAERRFTKLPNYPPRHARAKNYLPHSAPPEGGGGGKHSTAMNTGARVIRPLRKECPGASHGERPDPARPRPAPARLGLQFLGPGRKEGNLGWRGWRPERTRGALLAGWWIIGRKRAAVCVITARRDCSPNMSGRFLIVYRRGNTTRQCLEGEKMGVIFLEGENERQG